MTLILKKYNKSNVYILGNAKEIFHPGRIAKVLPISGLFGMMVETCYVDDGSSFVKGIIDDIHDPTTGVSTVVNTNLVNVYPEIEEALTDQFCSSCIFDVGDRLYSHDGRLCSYRCPDKNGRLALSPVIGSVLMFDSTYLSFSFSISKNKVTELVNTKSKNTFHSKGMACSKPFCREYNEYAEPNQEDGSYICYRCRYH